MAKKCSYPCPVCGKQGLKLGPARPSGGGERRPLEERIECAAHGGPVWPDFISKQLLDAIAPLDRRIRSPEDVEVVLAEVMQAAETDSRLSPSSLRVLQALHGSARDLTSVEVAAARAWLMGQTGLAEPTVRRALSRLDKTGYVEIIKPRQVSRRTLKNWLKRRETGRPPTLVRLADTAPEPAKTPGQNPRP